MGSDLQSICEDLLNQMANSVDVGESLEELEQLCKIMGNDAEAYVTERFRREIVGDGRHAEQIKKDICLYSWLLDLNKSEEVYQEFLHYLIDYDGDELTWQNYYFLFQQIESILFQTPDLNTDENISLSWKILQKAFLLCKKELHADLTRIPQSERNKGSAVVLVEQFLSVKHGPTKTALDRCKILQRNMGKNVLLINTAELLTQTGYVPYYKSFKANYRENLKNCDSVDWKGEHIAYYQCENNMPDLQEIETIVLAVRRFCPSVIVLVGGSSLLAGILNEIVEVVTVGTLPSRPMSSLAKYQIINPSVIEKFGETLINKMDLDESRIIPGVFTSSLKPQTEHVEREELGLRKDAFAIAVVGARLTDEVDDAFLEMLAACVDDDMQVGLIGGYALFEEKLDLYPKLRGKLLNLGFCDDILSRIEHFDLYVNPLRRGGGTSCLEAMSKGLPVVTVNYGDVACTVGEQFSCQNYDEMRDLIIRYRDDKKFYRAQSEAAKELAAKYLDSETEFVRVMEEYERRVEIYGDADCVL